MTKKFDSFNKTINRLAYKFGGSITTYESSKIVILPVPYDGTTSYLPGTRFGPQEIINASRFLEFYDMEEEFGPYENIIFTDDEIETSKNNPKDVIMDVKYLVSKILNDGKFPVILGGEHSISLGPILSFLETKKKFTVIQFDAHTDLREEYENTAYSHASIARRILEYTDLIQIGIRSSSKEEMEFIKKHNKPTILKALDFSLDKLYKILKNAQDNIYITLDVDVFDPSIIPSVGTPEPGGLTFRDISDALKLINCSKNVIGIDFVELAPIPGLIHPNFTISKLIYRFIGFLLKKAEKNGRYSSI